MILRPTLRVASRHPGQLRSVRTRPRVDVSAYLVELPIDCLGTIIDNLGNWSLLQLWMASRVLQSQLERTTRLSKSGRSWYADLTRLGATRDAYGVVEDLVLVDQAYRQHDYELMKHLATLGLRDLLQARGGRLPCRLQHVLVPVSLYRALIMSGQKEEIEREMLNNHTLFFLGCEYNSLIPTLTSFWLRLDRTVRRLAVGRMVKRATLDVLQALVGVDPTLPSIIEEAAREGNILSRSISWPIQRYLITITHLPAEVVSTVDADHYPELLALTGYTADEIMSVEWRRQPLDSRSLVALLDLGATINRGFAYEVLCLPILEDWPCPELKELMDQPMVPSRERVRELLLELC